MKQGERVIICGGGSVGMVSALALVQQGIPVTVLESFAEPPQDPRAATIHPSTLEMLDSVGLAAGVIEKGLKAPAFQFRDRKSQEIVAVLSLQQRSHHAHQKHNDDSLYIE